MKKENIITVYNKCDKEHIDFVTEWVYNARTHQNSLAFFK